MSKPRIRPQRWQPPGDRGLTGAFAANTRLQHLTPVSVPGTGPEDIAISPDGWVFTGVEDGRILRLPVAGGPVEHVVHTGGRPLGIEVAADGDLIVCDADAGLLRVDPTRPRVTVLIDQIGGTRPLFINNAAETSDGTIFFTDSSTTAPVHYFKSDLLEHGRTGRLFRLDPDGTLDLVLDGLAFSNGVALSPDGEFLMLAETGAYQISKVWLTGSRAGQREVVLANLPGLPDNMSTGSDGVFWVALPSLRNRLLDLLLPRPGWLRKAVWALPEGLQPDASRTAFAIGIDSDGNVVHNLQADGSRFHYVTGVREAAGHLWFGSLVEPAIAKVPWPA